MAWRISKFIGRVPSFQSRFGWSPYVSLHRGSKSGRADVEPQIIVTYGPEIMRYQAVSCVSKATWRHATRTPPNTPASSSGVSSRELSGCYS